MQSPLLLIFIVVSCRFCCSLQLHVSQDCAMQMDGTQGASCTTSCCQDLLCVFTSHVSMCLHLSLFLTCPVHTGMLCMLHTLCMLTFNCIQTLFHHVHHQVADCFPHGGLECEDQWGANVPVDPGTPMHWWRVNESQHHLCINFFEMQSTPLIFQHFPPSPKQNPIGREQ